MRWHKRTFLYIQYKCIKSWTSYKRYAIVMSSKFKCSRTVTAHINCTIFRLRADELRWNTRFENTFVFARHINAFVLNHIFSQLNRKLSIAVDDSHWRPVVIFIIALPVETYSLTVVCCNKQFFFFCQTFSKW